MDINVKLEGQVKNCPVYSDGIPIGAVLDKNLNLQIQDGHAAYREAASRGRVNIASVAVTGISAGTAFSTTPPLALWNPVGSNVNLSVLRTAVAYLSGTLGYGIISYGTVIQATVPTSGTEITPKNALIGVSRGKGRVFTGSTQTAATVLYAPFSFGVEAAATALGITKCQDDVDGLIEIPPGYIFVMEATAGAGTSDLVDLGIMWEEIPTV
jgi:hypothetical protein